MIVFTVSGRELITASVSTMSVCKDSSSKLWLCVCNNDASIPLAEQIWQFHIPPMLLAAGGFIFHFIQSALLFWRTPWIFVWSTTLNEWINSYSAATRFGPFSERICLTFTFLVISLLRACMKKSVVILCETSVYCPAYKTSKHCIITFYFASFEFFLEWSKHVNCTIC